jgi:hypothetical protein
VPRTHKGWSYEGTMSRPRDWALEEAVRNHGRLRHIWADGAYSGELVEWWQSEHGIAIEVVGK